MGAVDGRAWVGAGHEDDDEKRLSFHHGKHRPSISFPLPALWTSSPSSPFLPPRRTSKHFGIQRSAPLSSALRLQSACGHRPG